MVTYETIRIILDTGVYRWTYPKDRRLWQYHGYVVVQLSNKRYQQYEAVTYWIPPTPEGADIHLDGVPPREIEVLERSCRHTLARTLEALAACGVEFTAAESIYG